MAIQSHTRVGVQSTLTLAATSRLTADTSPESAAWKKIYRLCSLVLRLSYPYRDAVVTFLAAKMDAKIIQNFLHHHRSAYIIIPSFSSVRAVKLYIG